jgi:pyruvate/oxaloacetate carboxyltransferase
MVSEYEAAKLQRDMRHELEGSIAAPAMCAAGLAIVALIAALGAGAERDNTIDVAAAQETTVAYEVTPEPE